VSDEEIARVADFFTGKGLQLCGTCATSHVISLTGSIEQIETALSIELWLYETNGHEYIATTVTPLLPAAIADLVAGIHGLNNRPFDCESEPQPPNLTSDVGVAPTPTVSAAPIAGAQERQKDPQPPFFPPEVASFYDFPEHGGADQRVSVLEFGGGFDPNILKQYFRRVLGTDGPSFNTVSVLGAKNNTTSGASVEVMLDLEILGSLIPEAEITVYFAPNNGSGWAEALRQAIFATRTPDVISVSWGAVEEFWSNTEIATIEKHLKAAVHLGITVCFSTGDKGVEPRGLSNVQRVNYPASSSFALACGGTTLSVLNGQIASEVVWRGYAQATGGGISTIFDNVPEWQIAAKPCRNLSTGKAGRGIPDVSGVASPQTGYNVLLNDGTWSSQGGTSAVAPLWAALVARMNGLLDCRLGFLNTRLYKLSEGFRDIVSGNNSMNSARGYSAGPGWDACTGLGSPNGKALLKAIANQVRDEQENKVPMKK